MSLQLHRPDGQGGLQPSPRSGEDWRSTLRSRRWRAASLGNSEMNPTSTAMAVVFWAVLAGLTFVLLMVGYGTHFWR